MGGRPDATRSACAPQPHARARDPVSCRWLRELREPGYSGRRATARLHELLLRMAYARLLCLQPPPRGHNLEELANEVADEAVVRVLGHLDDFRGLSSFTTWACQFVVTEVSVSLRRYRRQRRELPTELELIDSMRGAGSSAESELEQLELLRQVCAAVLDALTAHQRQVLLALAVDGESPQSLAASLATNPGALYKSLHDARRKLRERLRDDTMPAAGKNCRRRDSNVAETMGVAT